MMHLIQYTCARITEKYLTGKNLSNLVDLELKKNIKLKDRQAIKSIVSGLARNIFSIIFIIDNLTKRELKLDALKSLLIVAVYQIRFSKTPTYAVVNSAVDNTKKIDIKKKNFVNAILRNYIRKRENLEIKIQKEIHLTYSYPKWWIKILKNQYPKSYINILEKGNEKPPLTLRVNKKKISVKRFSQMLIKETISHSIIDFFTIVLSKNISISRIPGFDEGLFSVQDYGAQQASKKIRIKKNVSMLDGCAAPGGKTCDILEKMDVNLIVNDNNLSRLNLLKENFKRLALSAKIINKDITSINEWWLGPNFDRIVLDVPCTGSGVIKRNPDIKWLRKKSDITKFTDLQSKMLKAAWEKLSKNGYLLYITCSIFKQENENQIESFRNEHINPKEITIEFKEQLIPNNYHDGFFFSLLKKN